MATLESDINLTRRDFLKDCTAAVFSQFLPNFLRRYDLLETRCYQVPPFGDVTVKFGREQFVTAAVNAYYNKFGQVPDNQMIQTAYNTSLVFNFDEVAAFYLENGYNMDSVNEVRTIYNDNRSITGAFIRTRSHPAVLVDLGRRAGFSGGDWSDFVNGATGTLASEMGHMVAFMNNPDNTRSVDESPYNDFARLIDISLGAGVGFVVGKILTKSAGIGLLTGVLGAAAGSEVLPRLETGLDPGELVMHSLVDASQHSIVSRDSVKNVIFFSQGC